MSAEFSDAARMRLHEMKLGSANAGDLRSGSRHGQETGRNGWGQGVQEVQGARVQVGVLLARSLGLPVRLAPQSLGRRIAFY